HHNHKPRNLWKEATFTKQELTELFEWIENHRDELQLPEDMMKHQWKKHTIIEKLNFSLDSYLKKGNMIEEEELVLVYYDVKRQTKVVRSFAREDIAVNAK